jgi:hypothetical protein
MRSIAYLRSESYVHSSVPDKVQAIRGQASSGKTFSSLLNYRKKRERAQKRVRGYPRGAPSLKAVTSGGSMPELEDKMAQIYGKTPVQNTLYLPGRPGIVNLCHAAALALVFLASSCTDMSTINAATQRAEAARQRALAAEARAEQSAELAAPAYKSTRTAASCCEGTAYQSVRRANEAVARFEPALTLIAARPLRAETVRVRRPSSRDEIGRAPSGSPARPPVHAGHP